MSADSELRRFLTRRSFVELTARARALAILDKGSARELVGPFDRQHSVWLEMQNIVPQEDDGVIVMHGRIDGEPAVVIAIEGAFQGGSMGEVGGQKIVCALEFAKRDHEKGRKTRPVLLLETGGVRLQEANLGLAVIAEIQSAIIALRTHVSVVGVIAGVVGCFGGMSLAAALCSRLIVTRQARLGMNGPEVIEQEAGVKEMEAADKRTIWSLIGGEQRVAVGLADELVEDDADDIAEAVRAAFRRPKPVAHRSEQVEFFLDRLAAIDPDRVTDGAALQALWGGGEAK
jgi:malonate decarboxylase beta subunit